MLTSHQPLSSLITMAVSVSFFFLRISLIGVEAIETQLYSIPPWAGAFAFSMCIAYLSDKFKHRFLFTIIPMLISMAGLGILMNIHNNRDVQYGALFLVTGGCYSAMPVVVCWFAMNLGGHRRRSVGTAWQVGFGNSKRSLNALLH